MNILISGDDVKSVNIMAFTLRQEGYDVSTVVDRIQFEQVGTDYPADILILDLEKVDQETLNWISEIRNSSSIAILLVTNPISEYELIAAYDAGVDDYLFRPYRYQMLLAHVYARMRRARSLPSALVPDLSASNIRLDPERHTVTSSTGEVRQLTNLEFRLLYCLMVNRGHVLTTETIIEKVWGYTGEGDRNLLKSLISRLRAKIEPQMREPKLITTIPGIGYMFATSDGNGNNGSGNNNGNGEKNPSDRNFP